MSTRTILVVFLALVCGAAMAISVLNVSRGRTATMEATAMEDVVIATEAIERGKTFGAPAIAVQKWPKGWAPEGTIRTVEATKDKVLISPVVKGELILASKLADKDAGILDIRIAKGMRAYTVMASRVPTNVAGFVCPESIVDVLLNMKGGGRGDMTGGGSTTTLLQAVKVLAVDQRLDPTGNEKVDTKGLSSVTLEVTYNQANMLDLGQNMGQLSLSLRNPEDRSTVDAEPATVDNIRFHGEPALPDPDKTPPPPEMLALLGLNSPPKPVTARNIVTWRGVQRGRVWLSETDR